MFDTLGILVESLPVGNSRETFHKSKKKYYYADILDATQIAALPEEGDGKNRLAGEQTLISIYTFARGRKDRRKFSNVDHIWNWETNVIRGCSMRWRGNSKRNEMKSTKYISCCRESSESGNHWSNFNQFFVDWRRVVHSGHRSHESYAMFSSLI